MSRTSALLAPLRQLAFGLVIGLGVTASLPVAAEDLLVFAAASLKNALDEAAAAYREETGTKVVASYAASGALARQIENGAPADLFISADLDWMDYVEHRKLIRPESRFNLLGNRLVLVGPKESSAALEIRPGMPLARLLGNSRLAIGDPLSVPAGHYAKQALIKLGLWDSVQGKLAPAGDVRSALRLVSRGEAPLGIVYETDAKADAGVTVLGVFPPDSHAPILYAVAQVTTSRKAEAAKLLAWLRGPAAGPFFARQGFTVLP